MHPETTQKLKYVRAMLEKLPRYKEVEDGIIRDNRGGYIRRDEALDIMKRFQLDRQN